MQGGGKECLKVPADDEIGSKMGSTYLSDVGWKGCMEYTTDTRYLREV